MDISSVTSNPYGVQPPQADRVQQGKQPEQLAEQQKDPVSANKEAEKQAAPRPVTNAFGQTTGTLVNITA